MKQALYHSPNDVELWVTLLPSKMNKTHTKYIAIKGSSLLLF